MRCGCFVLYSKTPKGRNKRQVVSWWHTELGPFKENAGFKVQELREQGFKPCMGEVKVSVNAVDDAYMGGHSAVLEINYLCSACDWIFYPHLPQNAEDLNKMVTERIATMGVLDEITIMEGALNAELESQRVKQEMLDRYHKRQAEERAARNERRRSKKVSQ